MKTSEILDKVTLEFEGGGKLELSDYTPYISNAEDDVKELSGGIKDLFKLFYNISPDGLCSREWNGNEYEYIFISLDSIKNIDDLSIYTNNYDSCLYFLYKLDNPDVNNAIDNELNIFNYPVPNKIEIYQYNGLYYFSNIVTVGGDYGWEEVNVVDEEENTETYYICKLMQK